MKTLLKILAFVVLIGCPVHAREASGKFISMGEFKLTAYCSCYECSEGYEESTAMETTARCTHTIAVDPDVIPFGSQVLIGDTVYVAEDCGGAVQGDVIDIYMNTHEEVENFGIHYTNVYIVKEVEW